MLGFSKMRLMDRHLGSVLCGCFSLVKRMERRFQRSPEEPLHLQKILVTKYFGMGSLILASPMVRALRQRYPNARIDLLTIEQNRALSEILTIFDKVHTVDTRTLRSVVKSMLSALHRIRREKYDVVIDAEFFSRLSSLVTYLVRARYSVGFYLPEIWRGNFLTHPVHFNYYRHAILGFMALARSLGAESADYALERLVISNEAEKSVRAKLKTLGVRPGQRLICVNVNTGPLSPERRWPEENFVKLIQLMLSKFPDIIILLIGAPSDLPLVTKIHALVGSESQDGVFNVAGKFSLPEICALLRTSELLITNDSGPLHLAEALATPAVSFFGPETPLLYGPTGHNQVVFYKGIYCSPCLNVHNQKQAPCKGNNVCMKLISPEEVFASTEMVLQRLPFYSPYRVSFDDPANQLLTDYRSPKFVSPLDPQTIPVSPLPHQAGPQTYSQYMATVPKKNDVPTAD
jgi:lipopolysaccharide heptosyltransferase II